MDTGGYYDVEVKGVDAKRRGIIMSKLKGGMDKGGHYDVEMTWVDAKGGHYQVQIKSADGYGRAL